MNIVVTGASKGIGYEMVKSFASDNGNEIIAISRNHDLLQTLKTECDKLSTTSKVHLLPFDLNSGQMPGLFQKIKNIFSNVDVLVNNAGLLIKKPFVEMLDSDFNQLFDSNVKSVFKLIKTLVPLFHPQSHIVNISSMGGYQGSAKFPGLSLYSASKGALAVFTECLAEELKDQGIKANCLALGAVQTEMLTKAFPGYEAPLKPEEMAEFIKDFALTGHKVFNGKILPVSLSTP